MARNLNVTEHLLSSYIEVIIVDRKEKRTILCFIILLLLNPHTDNWHSLSFLLLKLSIILSIELFVMEGYLSESIFRCQTPIIMYCLEMSLDDKCPVSVRIEKNTHLYWS